MRRITIVFCHLMVMLGLVLFQAPSLCKGDGEGHACSTASCACVADCTCQVAHRESRGLAQRLADMPHCRSSDEGLIKASDALLAACHADEPAAHFSLPQRGPTLAAGLVALPDLFLVAIAPNWRTAPLAGPTGPPRSPTRPPWLAA